MSDSVSGGTDQLFNALAEQLKLPLLQIARLAELSPEVLPTIAAISEQALMLVDAYVLSKQQMDLLLEPVAASSVLYDVAQFIEPFAKQSGYQVEIDLKGNSKPIITNRQNLQAMLTLLGTSLIEAGAEDDTAEKYLVLGTHRSARGTVVGAFSNQVSLSQQAINLTRQLHGRANQTAPELGLAGSARLAIADMLSERLHAPLKAYRHRSMLGIGSLLLPSKQLILM